ncbi:MAG: NAD(+)/NADH kinase [Clostridiaceae bacterium]|nr:NAD(+)/NADH kinase [Clostridiaceae bacterium]
MKTIGVFVNRNRDKGFKYTRILLESMRDKGITVLLPAGIVKEICAGENGCCESCVEAKDDDDVFTSADLVICLGGDGTFLKVARKVYKKGIPVLGINLGNVGFLTEIERDDIKGAVNKLVDGEYTIEERMMLDTSIIRNRSVVKEDTALNDVVISRGALSKILHLKTYINGEFVDMFPGDGVIVSSPTGSTAYSLSAGGPIVEPNIDLIIISPICPHILYSRSIVTASDRVVKVVVDEDYHHKAMVTVDGQMGCKIRGGDAINVVKSRHRIKLVRIHPQNFFDVLRTKIYFRGESVRKDEIQQACQDS